MRTNLRIRKAKSIDSNKITKLAKSIKINYGNPQEEGFLVYVLDEDNYSDRIKKTPYFYIAEEDNKLMGFLMCYDNFVLKRIAEEKAISHEGKIVEFVLEQDKPFIFGDQIAINSKHIFQGVGKMLMAKLFEDMELKNIEKMFVGILHKPIKNITSLNFCNSFGFEQVGEVTNRDGLVWGIYKLEVCR